MSVSHANVIVKEKHKEINLCGGLLKYKSPRYEKLLRLDCVERVELYRTFLSRFSRRKKIKIYSDASRRAWLSVRIPEKSAEAMLKALASYGPETGRILPGPHSAAVCAITSGRTAALLIMSAFFTAFGAESAVMNIIAALSLAIAFAHILFTAAAQKNLSLIRHVCGISLTKGFSGSKTIFIPDKAVTGAVFRQGPAGIICGSGSVGLITAGGSEITCASHVSRSETENIIWRLIGASGGTCTVLSGKEELKKNYVRKLTVSLFAAFSGTILAFTTDNEPFLILTCPVGAIMTYIAIDCLIGLKSADVSGLKIFPSAIFASGTVNCMNTSYCIKRNCVSEVRIRSGIFRRMNDMCITEPVPKGRRHSVKCACVPYKAATGFLRRF